MQFGSGVFRGGGVRRGVGVLTGVRTGIGVGSGVLIGVRLGVAVGLGSGVGVRDGVGSTIRSESSLVLKGDGVGNGVGDIDGKPELIFGTELCDVPPPLRLAIHSAPPIPAIPNNPPNTSSAIQNRVLGRRFE